MKQITVSLQPTILKYCDDDAPCWDCPFKADDTGGNYICAKTGWIGSDEHIFSACPFIETETRLPSDELITRFVSLVRAKYPQATLWVEHDDDDGGTTIYHNMKYSDPSNEKFWKEAGTAFYDFFVEPGYTTVCFVYNRPKDNNLMFAGMEGE